MRPRIFISYSKHEPEPTRQLATYLEGQGYFVWWDTNLVAGEAFNEVIDRELDAAHAVIVIWTPSSIKSKWVLSEARHAEDQQKLIPVRTSQVPFGQIPKPYSVYHTVLVEDHVSILAAVERLAGRPRPSPGQQENGQPLAPSRAQIVSPAPTAPATLPPLDRPVTQNTANPPAPKRDGSLIQELAQLLAASIAQRQTRTSAPEKPELVQASNLHAACPEKRARAPLRKPSSPSTWGKVSRNEPCPCHSGKKYRHCHGRFD